MFSLCQSAIDRAEAANQELTNGDKLDASVDAFLSNSVVGSLFPFLVSSLSLLAQNHGPSLATTLESFGPTIKKLLQQVGGFVGLIPEEERTVSVRSRVVQKVSQDIESAQPYENSSDKYETFCFAGAPKLVITIDDQSRTEGSYDWVKILERWRPVHMNLSWLS